MPRTVALTEKTAIVVPCYNEAERLATDEFRRFVRRYPDVSFLFVDDGSRDHTRSVLEALRDADPSHFAMLSLAQNGGKAEAVRRGMLHVLAHGALGSVRYVGYWDADLATPLAEIPRFIEVLTTSQACEACFGSRVRLLGRTIERRALRHYLGRLFATAASVVLSLAVYDTQCGAKLFRATPGLRGLFETPFCVNWTFDVELIARMHKHGDLSRDVAERIYELPLNMWRDVTGSKVKPADFVRGLGELLRIWWNYGFTRRRVAALSAGNAGDRRP